MSRLEFDNMHLTHLTVCELRSLLQGVDDNLPVVMASAQYPGSPGLRAGSARVSGVFFKVTPETYDSSRHVPNDLLWGPVDVLESGGVPAFALWPVST
jgi:hypothetical protein